MNTFHNEKKAGVAACAAGAVLWRLAMLAWHAPAFCRFCACERGVQTSPTQRCILFKIHIYTRLPLFFFEIFSSFSNCFFAMFFNLYFFVFQNEVNERTLQHSSNKSLSILFQKELKRQR
jgi:hypothetical protein